MKRIILSSLQIAKHNTNLTIFFASPTVTFYIVSERKEKVIGIRVF